MIKTDNQFNVVIVGTGGQGLITLLRVMAEAALVEGYDVKTSELHGLSQRGGSVEVHIKFGKKIYSPLVARGKANLVFALEMQEALRAYPFAYSETSFLINKYAVPIPFQKLLSEDKILRFLRKTSKKVVLIPAADICQKEFATIVTGGIFMLSYASVKNLIPLKPNSILRAMKKIIPKKYLSLNLKTFNLAQKHEES